MKPKRTEPAELPVEVDPHAIEAVLDEDTTREAAPEVTPETQQLTEWDTPPDATGSAVPKTEADDEATVAEQLVKSGLSEADRDQRLAAVDPDFQP